MVFTPLLFNFTSKLLQIVDFPEPESPVNQTTKESCLFKLFLDFLSL